MRSGQCVPDRRVSPVGCMRSCGMRTADAVIGRAACRERHSPMRSAPPLLVRILCGEQQELLGTPNPRVSGSHVRAPRGPRVRTSSRSTLSARFAPLPSRTPTLPSRSRSTTVPHATARPAGCASGRARRPTARVPPAADAGALPLCQFGSATESVSTAILRHPHKHQIMGACFVDAHGDLVPAGGQHDLPAAASSREACSLPAPTRSPGP